MTFDLSVKGVQCFHDELSDIKERWHDRFPLKGRSWSKGYIDGRLWITLNGKWRFGPNCYEWACRITAKPQICDRFTKVNPSDVGDGDGWNDEVVFVVVVDVFEQPQMIPSVVFGPYLFENKFFGAGQGTLHLGKMPVAMKIIPVFRDREVNLSPFVVGPLPNNRSCKVVKCGAEVMNRVTDHQCKDFWDWFQRVVCQIKVGGLCVWGDGVGLDAKVKPVGRKSFGNGDDLINVFVGPFGFEPRPSENIKGYFRDREL